MKKIAIFLICSFISTPILFAKKTDYDFDSGEDTQDKAVHGSSSHATGSTVKGMASGVKQVAYEGPKDLLEETTEDVSKKPPIVSVVEGVNRGTQKLVDHTIKGAYKVATLGTSELDSYEVQEPEKGSGEPTKFKISLPGT